MGKPPRVVGIDLTGSEKRATGWALMDGAAATTKSIRTDEELIRETLAAKPDLVSIDSPLSLPENYGAPGVPIYRKCELALKRSEEHTSELQSHLNLVCRLLLEKKKKNNKNKYSTYREY